MVSLPHAVTLCPSSSHPLTYCFNIRNCCHQGQDGWLYLIGSKSKLHYGRPIRKWEAVTRSMLKVTAAIVNTLNFSPTASSVNTFWCLLSGSVSLPSKVSIVHSLTHTTQYTTFFQKTSSLCMFILQVYLPFSSNHLLYLSHFSISVVRSLSLSVSSHQLCIIASCTFVSNPVLLLTCPFICNFSFAFHFLPAFITSLCFPFSLRASKGLASIHIVKDACTFIGGL